MAEINWSPLLESSELLEDKDVIFSIGGDIYTLGNDNKYYNKNLANFGNYAERRGIPYVLWGASVGPFTQNPEAERYFRKHLSNISLITVRERDTINYLAKIGVSSNVISCADPAFAVETGIVKKNSYSKDKPTIAINLSPLSVRYIGLTDEQGIEAQTRTIELIIKKYDADVVLVPHVVCDFDERDDDRRYLRRIYESIAQPYRDRVQLVDGDPGFIGLKKVLISCDLVIAARMHCAINAMVAHVPTLLLAYSQKANGMGDYVYHHRDWVLPLSDFCSEKCISKIGDMLDKRPSIQAGLSMRIPETQADTIRPLQALKKILKQI